jgi:hypothetical protein
MVTLRVRLAALVFSAAVVLPFSAASAAVPDYRLGDVAADDVITPVPLLVVNPEATDALRQKVAQQVVLIVRHLPQAAAEAEADLRKASVAARANFVVVLEGALGRSPLTEDDLKTPAYASVLRAAKQTAKDFPFDRLAPLWVRGQSDEPMIAAMVQAVRDVMAQPIVTTKNDAVLPPNSTVRLLPVKSFTEAPTPRELETGGALVSVGKILSLWRARRVVETGFPVGQEALGKYAATFARANASPDPALTEVARAQRMDGVTVNDTYETGQAVVKKGQTIDRRALSALAAVREKSLIGTLQTRIEERQSFTGLIMRQTKWMTAGMALVVLILCVVLWRLRARPSAALVLAGDPAPGGAAGDGAWRTRALAAEGQADRAHAAIRSGVMGWMKEKVVRSLVGQRADLLSAQQKAEAEMRELESRLEQLHTPLQQRISAYEARIVELEKDLAAKGEENRELIGARISVAKQQLMVERERGRTGQG